VNGAPLETFTILTTEANSLIRPIHDRMPVILPHERYIAWLSPDSEPDELLPLLTPYRAEEMQCIPERDEEAEVNAAACHLFA
jgi:putative SOS response-associated peptidase YedK